MSWMFTTSPYASNPNLLVANDVATGFLELKISSSSSSCERSASQCHVLLGGWRVLTVLFLVSGMKKKTTIVWTPHHAVKIIYVFQPIFWRLVGQANWLSKPARAFISKIYTEEDDLIEHTCCDNKTRESHTLGSHLKWQDLDRIQSLQWSKSNGVNCSKDVDESKRDVTCCFIRSDRLQICRVWYRVLVESGGDGKTEPDKTTSGVGEEEKRSTTNAIDKISADQSKDKLLTVVDKNDVGFLYWICLTNCVKHLWHEVRKHSWNDC